MEQEKLLVRFCTYSPALDRVFYDDLKEFDWSDFINARDFADKELEQIEEEYRTTDWIEVVYMVREWESHESEYPYYSDGWGDWDIKVEYTTRDTP